MFVKLRYESHAIFPDDPSRFVAVPVIFESVIDRNSCHPNIHTRFQRIAFRIEPQNRRMLCDSIAQQNHINVVVKIFFRLTRWFLSFQFVDQQKGGYVQRVSLFAQEMCDVRPATECPTLVNLCLELALKWNQQISMYHK